MSRLERVKQERLKKIKQLQQLGIDPFPSKVPGKRMPIVNAKQRMEKEVEVVGRILGWREHGSSIFADLIDESGKIQLFFQQRNLRDEFKILKLFDVGDFLYAKGSVFKTKVGEVTVDVTKFTVLTKTLRPLPSTWHGLKDVEERYRKRYLDTILNPESKRRLKIHSHVIGAIRQFLNARKFIEVETPTLQPVYGGGFARPFITHHNTLNSDFYLRISDEMYLKRLLVGGFEKVYEITKVFRNEGVDHDHNPEFTMFEAQIAYEDYTYGMDLIEEIVEYTAKEVLGTMKVNYQGARINFQRPWKRLRLIEAVKQFSGEDSLQWKSVKAAKAAAVKLGIKSEKQRALNRMTTIGEVLAFVFEEVVEKQLIQPTITYDYPIEVSPLAKKCEDKRFTQRFEMFAGGSEFGNNYSELNDPVDLRQRFIEEKKRELAGFAEAQQTDEDYLTAIEHGFPPTCGIAIGIDRLAMLFTDSWSIREVIAFPTLKPLLTKQKLPLKQQVKGKLIELDSSFTRQYPSASVGYALLEGVKIKVMDEKLEKEKEKALKIYKELELKDINKFPEIKSYRQMYKKMGVDLHSRSPSPEALLKRVAMGKVLYAVNTCVDAYNLVVIRNRVSLGAFDADKLSFPCSVKVAEGGETIDLLGVKARTTVKAGEVFYADQDGPYNLDYNYRDSQRTKITTDTKNIFINVDGIYEITPNLVKRSLEESIAIIQKYCGGKVVEKGILRAS